MQGMIFRILPATGLYGLPGTCFPRDTSFLPERKRHLLALGHSNQAFKVALFCSAWDTEVLLINFINH